MKAAVENFQVEAESQLAAKLTAQAQEHASKIKQLADSHQRQLEFVDTQYVNLKADNEAAQKAREIQKETQQNTMDRQVHLAILVGICM